MSMSHRTNITKNGVKYSEDFTSESCPVCGKPSLHVGATRSGSGWAMAYAHAIHLYAQDHTKKAITQFIDCCKGPVSKTKKEAEGRAVPVVIKVGKG